MTGVLWYKQKGSHAFSLSRTERWRGPHLVCDVGWDLWNEQGFLRAKRRKRSLQAEEALGREAQSPTKVCWVFGRIRSGTVQLKPKTHAESGREIWMGLVLNTQLHRREQRLGHRRWRSMPEVLRQESNWSALCHRKIILPSKGWWGKGLKIRSSIRKRSKLLRPRVRKHWLRVAAGTKRKSQIWAPCLLEGETITYGDQLNKENGKSEDWKQNLSCVCVDKKCHPSGSRGTQGFRRVGGRREKWGAGWWGGAWNY